MLKNKFFISHAAEDAPVAELLRTWAHDLFADRCEVFVSTTYESLLPGNEWFPEIKAALGQSKLLFCLVGPRSKKRPWLYFESGAAWLNGIPVVPVTHSGLQATDLGLPLNQLQALNLQGEQFLERFCRRVADVLRLGTVPKNIDWDAFRSKLAVALTEVRGPREVVSLWQEAMKKGDVRLAETLTSVKAHDYIKTVWGSLESLSKKFQDNLHFVTIHEEERIEGDAAFVAYRTYYQDKTYSVKRWQDLVVIESGEWKIAPQFVVWEDITPTRRSSWTRKKAPRR